MGMMLLLRREKRFRAFVMQVCAARAPDDPVVARAMHVHIHCACLHHFFGRLPLNGYGVLCEPPAQAMCALIGEPPCNILHVYFQHSTQQCAGAIHIQVWLRSPRPNGDTMLMVTDKDAVAEILYEQFVQRTRGTVPHWNDVT